MLFKNKKENAGKRNSTCLSISERGCLVWILMKKTMDEVVSYCKQYGFIFQGSEIYGGLANTWDYGPLGTRLKNQVKDAWRYYFIQMRENSYEVDADILMNPRVLYLILSRLLHQSKLITFLWKNLWYNLLNANKHSEYRKETHTKHCGTQRLETERLILRRFISRSKVFQKWKCKPQSVIYLILSVIVMHNSVSVRIVPVQLYLQKYIGLYLFAWSSFCLFHLKKYAKEILEFMKKRLIRSNLKQILYFAISFEIKGQLQVQIKKKNK